MDLSTLLSTISTKRWFAIRRALDMSMEEITSDSLAMLVVAVNEQRRVESGKDDFTNVLELSPEQLAQELGLGDDDDTKSDETE